VILEELELRNFRSHKKTTVRFNEGIMVIVGENGSGKTSILEGVGYALFRETPSRVKLEELVRRGREKEGMRVSLTFRADGRQYKVLRSYAEGKSISMLYDSQGRLISSGEKKRQTTGEIEKKVHLDSKLFSNAIYIRQGQIDALLTADARERKELIGKLIGTRELEKAFVNMREILGEYELRCQGYIGVLEEMKEKEAKIKDAKNAVGKLRKDADEVDKKLRKRRAEKESKEKEAEILERTLNLEKELRLKEQELEGKIHRLKEIEESEEVVRNTERSKRRYDELEEEIRVLEKDTSILEEGQKSLKRLQEELLKREQRILQLESLMEEGLRKGSGFLGRRIDTPDTLEEEVVREKGRLEESLEELEEGIKELERKIGELHGKNKEIQDALEELKEAGERCPVCQRPLTEEHRMELIKEYKENIDHNNTAISGAMRDMKKLERERGKCLERLRKAREINVEIIKKIGQDIKTLITDRLRLEEELKEKEEAAQRISELKKALEVKMRERGSLRQDYERYIAAVGFLRRNAPEREDIFRQLESLRKEISQIEGKMKMAGVPPDMTRLKSVRREIKDLYDKITILSNIKSARKAEAREKERTLKSLAQELRLLEQKKEEGERLEKFLQLLNKIRGTFHKDNLQRRLRAMAKPLIEKHAREEFHKFHLPYSDISLSEDFEISLYGPDGKVGMDMLSGGERIAAALALRIGIAKALAGPAMELLMLDEPTIHLDAVRRRELVEIIKNLTSLPQTVVVTHDKEFEGAADKLLEVEKVDGASRVKGGVEGWTGRLEVGGGTS
jgi:exonuclease SbcC